MASKPTLKIILDQRRTKKSNVYPVKLRITYNRDSNYYACDYDMVESDFDEVMFSVKPGKKLKDIRLELNAKLGKAKSIIDSMKYFSFEAFDRLYYGPDLATDVFGYYSKYREQLKMEERLGTEENYRLSMQSLQSFLKHDGRKTDKLLFEEVNANWLLKYERYMLSQEKSLTSVGIYLRPLRALYNLAIEEGAASRDLYPFTRNRYQIPGGAKTKKALPKATLGQLFTADTSINPIHQKARDLWFFSFACNGINLKDVAELRWENIEDDRIVFTRAKTRLTTKRNQKEIVAYRNDFINDILKRYGVAKDDSNGYVFDILKDSWSADEKRKAVKNMIRFVNQHIKKLAEANGITGKVSYNWARHSFTTKLMQEGASLEMLQECLGHQNKQTTQNYWAGFDDELKRELSKNIMNF
jgi:site-specific recombinase XerD